MVKILIFPTFFNIKFQAFCRPGKVNDKIPGFLCFPGSVGTLSWLVLSTNGLNKMCAIYD